MKRFISLCLMLYFMVFTSSCVYAMGAATVYKITIKEVQLLNDKGTWVTIATPNQEIDIASAAVGATAGSMLANANVPTGKYVNFRVVFSNVIKFAGSDPVAPTGTITLTGTAASAASTTTWPAFPPVTVVNLAVNVGTWQAFGGVPGEVTETLNLGAFAGFNSNNVYVYGINPLSPPIEIKDSSKVSCFYQFDTATAVGVAGVGGPMFLVPPQIGTSFGITVDGTTTPITGANMRTDFNQ